MPRLPTLFIDTLSVTIPLEDTRGQEVLQAINDSFEWSNFIYPAAHRSQRYPNNYSFNTPEGHSAFLSLKTGSTRNNHLRLEYSPNNFGESGRALLGGYLRGILGDGYLEEIQNAKLTRLDVAFDVRRVPLKDFLIVDTKERKSSIIRGLRGEAESFYFPFKGTNQLCVYDKLRERNDAQEPPPSNRKQAPWVRFEFRYRKLTRHTLNSLLGRLGNPFDNFEVKQFGMTRARISAERLRMFFDGCRLAGVDSVLEEIPDIAAKETLALAYRTFPVPTFWQRRTSIWGGLRAAINNALPA